MYCVIPMITMMLLCSMITLTKFWSLCESHLVVFCFCLWNHIHSCKYVTSNPSTVLHGVYPAHNCTSTMQQQTATQLVSGTSAKQGTHALVVWCHSQPHTVGPGSLASLWKQRPSVHVLQVRTKHAVLVVLSPKTNMKNIQHIYKHWWRQITPYVGMKEWQSLAALRSKLFRNHMIQRIITHVSTVLK